MFCVPADDTSAQLRILLVTLEARGHGLGGRLVDTCLRFARDAGYERMNLWTTGSLDAARHIYFSRGFELVGEEPPSTRFGIDFNDQVYERPL